MAVSQLQRIIFGLKIRQFRQERGWNFEDMRRETGISVSYLNEIEKGKKYPQPANRQVLAKALGLSLEFLESPELTKQFAPLGRLLQSSFMQDLPLDLFGIEIQQIVEIIARDPDRVNAFISALLDIARVYSFREENFYFAALRAYQELRSNYFEEIEEAASAFVTANQLPADRGVPCSLLAELLEKQFGYTIVPDGLSEYPELQEIRSAYNPASRRLLLNSHLNERQRAFQLAKELGFNALGLKERPLASTLLEIKSFEQVLNNYKAAYFAVALLINREAFVQDVAGFFQSPEWNSSTLFHLMEKYQASPEVFFQRFNVVTKAFGLEKVFFMRFIHDLERDSFDIDKELHINRRHQPHATGLKEHYCRRWVSMEVLQQLKAKTGQPHAFEAGVQRASFLHTGEEYLCIALAKTGYPTPGRNVSVTLGVLLDEQAKAAIGFWNDPAIPQVVVNVTCERCPLNDCRERAAPPTVVEHREAHRRMEELVGRLTRGT